MEVNRYRDAGNAMCKRAEQRRDVIRDLIFAMMAKVTRTAASMRTQADYL